MRLPLPPETFTRTLRAARSVATSNVRLTNATLRVAAGINYDQAVRFFREAVEAGLLERIGAGALTHYVIKTK
jgi:Fic family protein